MDEKQRAQAVLAALIITPIFCWFVSANIFVGFDQQYAKEQFEFYVKNTFNIPPLWGALLFGFVLAIVGSILAAIFGRATFKGAHFNKYYRGSRLVSAFQLKMLTKENKPQVTVADIPMPTDAENKHLAIAGATGTGKSTIFREMMLSIMRRSAGRREKMIILDPDGDYLSLFYKPGDKILNPFDARTEGWSFFNEIKKPFDFERFSKSIVQSSKSSDSEEWNNYGRLLLQEVAKKVYQTSRKPSMREVMRWTNQTSMDELEAFVTGTAAQAIFAGNERATSSVRFVLSAKLPPHLKMPEGDFSLREWISDPDAGNLFITWKEGQKEALKPLISAWVDTLISASLDLPTDMKRRIWLFIDELESLDNLPTLSDGLTKGRKKGLCCVTGFQSYAQVVEVYGENIAETILGQHRSLLTLAVGRLGTSTAKRMAEALGEHDVQRKRAGETSRFGDLPTTNTNNENQKEDVVMMSEIFSLQDLEGFLAFPGNLPIARVKFEPITFTRSTPVPGLVEADGMLVSR